MTSLHYPYSFAGQVFIFTNCIHTLPVSRLKPKLQASHNEGVVLNPTCSWQPVALEFAKKLQ